MVDAAFDAFAAFAVDQGVVGEGWVRAMTAAFAHCPPEQAETAKLELLRSTLLFDGCPVRLSDSIEIAHTPLSGASLLARGWTTEDVEHGGGDAYWYPPPGMLRKKLRMRSVPECNRFLEARAAAQTYAVVAPTERERAHGGLANLITVRPSQLRMLRS